jgi:hypothetical protein
MSAKAQRRRRVGVGCGSGALIPARAGNGGTGDPLARRSVGSVCFHVDYNIHYLSIVAVLASIFNA